MSPKPSLFTAAVLAVSVLCAIVDLGLCLEFRSIKFGGVTDFRVSDEVKSIARFAVHEHNKQSNALLEFGKVLKAKEQVVAGKIYHLTLEAIEAGKKTVYEAKVWVKPWMNFKQLQEFKRAVDVPHLTGSDLGVLRERIGWHRVPVYDPEVEDAANHAVRVINQRVNSVSKYKLLEILQAEAEVVKDYVKYNLILKLRMGSKDFDETMKVKVHKVADGRFKSV